MLKKSDLLNSVPSSEDLSWVQFSDEPDEPVFVIWIDGPTEYKKPDKPVRHCFIVAEVTEHGLERRRMSLTPKASEYFVAAARTGRIVRVSRAKSNGNNYYLCVAIDHALSEEDREWLVEHCPERAERLQGAADAVLGALS